MDAPARIPYFCPNVKGVRAFCCFFLYCPSQHRFNVSFSMMAKRTPALHEEHRTRELRWHFTKASRGGQAFNLTNNNNKQTSRTTLRDLRAIHMYLRCSQSKHANTNSIIRKSPHTRGDSSQQNQNFLVRIYFSTAFNNSLSSGWKIRHMPIIPDMMVIYHLQASMTLYSP